MKPNREITTTHKFETEGEAQVERTKKRASLRLVRLFINMTKKPRSGEAQVQRGKNEPYVKLYLGHRAPIAMSAINFIRVIKIDYPPHRYESITAGDQMFKTKQGLEF